MRASLAFASCVLALLTVAACGGQDEAYVAPLCSNLPAQPFVAKRVSRTFRAHGVELRSDPRSALCSASDIVAFLSNYDNDADHGGLIACVLRRHGIYGRLDLDPVSGIGVLEANAYKTHFVLANLECTVYPADSEAGRQHLAATRGALVDLQQSLH